MATVKARVRKRQMKIILDSLAIPMPQQRCAEAAGVSHRVMLMWKNYGLRLAVESGKLHESVLEEILSDDESLPKTPTMRKQCEWFALQWRKVEEGVEPALMRNIRRGADGHYVEETREKSVWVPDGDDPEVGRWVKKYRDVNRRYIAPDLKSAWRILSTMHGEYRQGIEISGRLRMEVEAMTDDELMAEFKMEEADG